MHLAISKKRDEVFAYDLRRVERDSLGMLSITELRTVLENVLVDLTDSDARGLGYLSTSNLKFNVECVLRRHQLEDCAAEGHLGAERRGEYFYDDLVLMYCSSCDTTFYLPPTPEQVAEQAHLMVFVDAQEYLQDMIVGSMDGAAKRAWYSEIERELQCEREVFCARERVRFDEMLTRYKELYRHRGSGRKD